MRKKSVQTPAGQQLACQTIVNVAFILSKSTTPKIFEKKKRYNKYNLVAKVCAALN